MISESMYIIIKVIFSLLLVIALMYIILKMIQKYSNFGNKLNAFKDGIKITGTTYIDEHTKIINLQRPGYNYILAVNKNNTTIIDKYEFDEQT
jgi:flagellar biogenesis protein FliO